MGRGAHAQVQPAAGTQVGRVGTGVGVGVEAGAGAGAGAVGWVGCGVQV